MSRYGLYGPSVLFTDRLLIRSNSKQELPNSIKLARTIDGLVAREEIRSIHLAEALQYRLKLTLCWLFLTKLMADG
jgi:hypothetical protein